jgi:hypothetical protein
MLTKESRLPLTYRTLVTKLNQRCHSYLGKKRNVLYVKTRNVSFLPTLSFVFCDLRMDVLTTSILFTQESISFSFVKCET